MMKYRRFAALLVCLLLMLTNAASAVGWDTNLTMRLSTRTGPSTAYTEPGTFFSDWRGVTVKVLSKALSGSTWWVQVEFSTGGKLYRAYTGAKRIAMDISYVPEEEVIGAGYVNLSYNVNAYYGPGTNYAPVPELVPGNAQGSIIAYENGFALLDFYDSSIAMQRRAWISADHLHIDWYTSQPSGGYDPLAPVDHSGRSYYANDGSDVCCQVLSTGSAGGYSYVNIYAYGKSYLNIPVYMECSKYGSFAVNEIAGNITFPCNCLFAELYFPALGFMQVTQLIP